MGTTTGLMTFEEFERLPDQKDEGYKLELLDGELIRRSWPDAEQMEIAHRLLYILKAALDDRHSRGEAQEFDKVFIHMSYRFGSSWLVPNVSISYTGQPRRKKYPKGSPVLAVEVISESNTVDEMHRKIVRYFEHGAREVWLFYPDTRSVSVYRGKTSVEIEGILTSELLPELSIDLAQVFG